jgi:hypothetical protein
MTEQCRILQVSLAVLVLLVGYRNRKVMTSAEDAR